MEIYYFTGTGNSLAISKMLKEGLREDVKLIPLETLEKYQEIVPEEKEVGFVFPVYFGDIPKYVKGIIEKFNFSNVEYIFALPNCYSIYGESLVTFEKILKGKGRYLNYGNVLYMPDNAILFPIEKDIEKLENIGKDILPVIEDIKNRVIKNNFSINLLTRFQCFGMQLFSEFDFSPKRFRVNKDCIGCGICEKVCPCNNIELKNGKPVFNSKCAHCLACFHWCPKEAISMINLFIRKRRKHKNPNVTLKEIERKR